MRKKEYFVAHAILRYVALVVRVAQMVVCLGG